ncbi:MAG TPA: hypothetical protein PLL20_08420 [Phycisphaerae bacterium]|nr:hypothetical protein [Phycisphaerae bacterium]HRR84420.1 hypothetical protein [Phycisphaerae bacterium]
MSHPASKHGKLPGWYLLDCGTSKPVPLIRFRLGLPKATGPMLLR